MISTWFSGAAPVYEVYMSCTTPPKWWASLIGPEAPLTASPVELKQVKLHSVPAPDVAFFMLYDFTFAFCAVHVVPDCVTRSAGLPPAPQVYWPVFWLPPGPVASTSALVRPS